MDSHKTWAPAVGEGVRADASPPPVKTHEKWGKFFLGTTYSSLWGGLFRYVRTFLLLLSPCGGPF